MSIPLTAAEVLNREFLEMRAKLLELAASFDRLDRADGATPNDVRLDKLRQALEIVNRSESGRAAEIQQLFSLPYDPQWQTAFADRMEVQRAGSASPSH